MKKTIKLLAVVLALMMVVSLALVACGPDEDETDTDTYTFSPYAAENYEDVSSALYDDILGEFNRYYSAAKDPTISLSLRYALMAQAEAKLYESGVLLPTQAQGGNYAVSKVANATVSSVAWGNDSFRLHYAIVATKPITKTDRAAMKAYRAEHGDIDGAAYLEWIRGYLSENGYETKTVYNIGYSSDPETFDVLASSKTVDSEPVVQTYDGLIEYDVMNKMQPALATAIPDSQPAEPADNPVTGAKNAETVTFTFTIREGQWINSEGSKVADLKADDFVAGFQHMLDAKGGLEYLVDGVVVGAHEYLDDHDFTKVKVTADEAQNTVTYQIYKSAESYFLTMLAYSVFAPMSRDYYTSQGGKFGTEYKPTASDYLYGTSYEHIAYCGPYYISEHTAESKMTFTANPTWWNKNTTNARNTETINWKFNDGSDDAKAYNDFKSGELDGCGLTGSNVTSAKTDKLSGDSGNIFDTYSYTSAMDSTAFCAFVNVNRAAFANFNDETKAVSPKTEENKARAYAALTDVHFRRALLTSINRESYMAQIVGQDLAVSGISNMYTPGTFVNLPEEVTVSVNGKSKTYEAGTMYGKIVQDQLDADGVKITVWKEVDSEYTYTGFDGWYNPTYAKAELEKAILALARYGITIDAQHPIEIDYPYVSSRTDYAARANTLKQGIESVLEGKVKINLVEVANSQEWQNCGYTANDGTGANYDIYDLSGWGPDYGDPQTYLDTMLPDYAGYMAKCLGLF